MDPAQRIQALHHRLLGRMTEAMVERWIPRQQGLKPDEDEHAWNFVGVERWIPRQQGLKPADHANADNGFSHEMPSLQGAEWLEPGRH